jgi:hypothetical protein
LDLWIDLAIVKRDVQGQVQRVRKSVYPRYGDRGQSSRAKVTCGEVEIGDRCRHLVSHFNTKSDLAGFAISFT